LADGLHTLNIRVKGTDNVWSLYKRAFFYIQTPSTNNTAQNIVAAEYYIDTDDLGVGNQTPLTITPGMVIDEAFTIPTTGLTDGLHALFIRVQDADNTWSLYKRAYFYVQTPNTNGTAQNIVAAEYYIDTDDLGVGNQTPLTITSGLLIDEAFTIPTTGLADGLHVLHIRVQDADNTWSLYKRAYFYINTPSSQTATPIVEAEYFFDTDPGVNNATAIAITSGFNVDEVFAIQVPIDMIDGDHYLYIRVKDQDNNWSLYKRELFTVDATLSVEDFDDRNLKVFPNPTHTLLNINFATTAEHTISVFDSHGKELIHLDTSALLNTIDLSAYSSGLYLLNIKNNNTQTSKTIKVIKS